MSGKVIEMPPPDATRLREETGKKLVGMAAVIAAAGVLACVVAAIVDARTFAFSYLAGFTYVATIGLGALFFVILQHLTKAGWSVAARRQMEWVAGVLPVCVILFIPIALLANHAYSEWWGDKIHSDHLLHKKAWWLNPTFFFVRAGVFLLLWAALAMWFSKKSADQDKSGDPKLTVKMQLYSAPTMILFALSLSFAAFDWLMSMQPKWYSTIFGVYVFAGSVTSSLSVLAVLTVILQKRGLYKRVSTVEHRHDIGKLMFGFVVFWTYIAFSQYMLQWYGNIPEEIIFYKDRWKGSWRTVSLILAFGHFVVPFIFLMSRTMKRSMPALVTGAIMLLVMHYVDLYWLIMPLRDAEGASPSWIDLAGLLGPVGVLLLVVAWRASRGGLYPLKDPRLMESMKVENL